MKWYESERAAEGCSTVLFSALAVFGLLGSLASLLAILLGLSEGQRVPWGLWAVLLGLVALFGFASVKAVRSLIRRRRLGPER